MSTMHFVESVAEILRNLNNTPWSRPRTYKGFAMRSTLETRWAAHLDEIGEPWVYEPHIFGRKGRGYLPDFEILGKPQPVYMEVKPTIKQAVAARTKMAVIWATFPGALLVTVSAQGCTFSACFKGKEWETWQERWT